MSHCNCATSCHLSFEQDLKHERNEIFSFSLCIFEGPNCRDTLDEDRGSPSRESISLIEGNELTQQHMIPLFLSWTLFGDPVKLCRESSSSDPSSRQSIQMEHSR